MSKFTLNDCKSVTDLGLTPGDTMVEYTRYDYGMVSDHEAFTGQPHINVSKDGQTPFYCLPRSAVTPSND